MTDHLTRRRPAVNRRGLRGREGGDSTAVMIDLRREGPVFVLTMRDGENRFNADFVAAMHAKLDEVVRSPPPFALVTTGTEKFYSNGLDLSWMMAKGAEASRAFLQDTLSVIGRVLTLPCYTVAAVNGHAFGAGAQLAIAHDLRLMRIGRGYWCMPEVDMHLPLHPGMVAILQARAPRVAVHEAIVTGRRWAAEDADQAGIIDRAVPGEALLDLAIEAATAMAGKADPVLERLKRSLYPQVFEAISRSPDDLFS
jgi:enoyl-CoA hydratase/carnithine racemase